MIAAKSADVELFISSGRCQQFSDKFGHGNCVILRDSARC
jgi:hypothetical protein